MTLFGNKQEANLKASAKMVETIIRELNLDPGETRMEWPGTRYAWGLMKGSAEVHVSLRIQDEDNFIRVWAYLSTLPGDPGNQMRLFRHLLEANENEIAGAAFAVAQDKVLLVTERSTLDLDLSEVRDMVKRMGHYADYYDDVLVSEFGGTRYCDLSRA